MKDKDNFDLEQLLHPAHAFNHPSEVVVDPDLTLNEKRAILASWASDACAIEASPELRIGPRSPVRFDAIMDALRELDRQAKTQPQNYRRLARKKRLGGLLRSGGSDQGQSLQ